MKKFKAWAAKHKGLVIAAAVGLGVILYLLFKGKVSGLTGSSGSSTTTTLKYPSSLSYQPAAATGGSRTRSRTRPRQGQNWKLQNQINTLLAAEIAAKAAQGSANTGTPQTVQSGPPKTKTLPKPLSASSGVIQSVVLAAAPNGKLFASKSYAAAVNKAGGRYKNHHFIKGHYQGARFVPKKAKSKTNAPRPQHSILPQNKRFRAIP